MMKAIQAIACCVALLWPALAAAVFPDKSIRVIVPFPPGGATDFIARILAQHLPAALGQSIEAVPGYDVQSWVGLFAPAGTPRPIIARLHDETVKVLRMAQVERVVLDTGAETVGNTPEEMRALLSSETAKWAKVAKSAGIKVD